MESRASGSSQATAAVQAGISERSGRRIDRQEHQPARGRPHNWRTRADPLAAVWSSELVPLLTRQPELQATTLLEYLQKQHPDQYSASILRTLQRRVRQWKATHGSEPTAMFPLEHRPGAMGLSDFTQFKQADITIQGQPFAHRLYHYRLAYSGWQYVQVIQGGESFIALSEGLQNALAASGGSPREHRTDSLSAAYRNLGGRRDPALTELYERLCQHYHLQPSRNNRGIAHENGAIEAAHGHFKQRLHQALLLRESFDFESVAAYQQFIETVVAQLNQRVAERFAQEQTQLQPLPTYRYADYEAISAKVTSYSTIQVRCITYTVPARLIGQTLTLHLHHDRLIGFLGREPVVELPRLYVPSGQKLRRARCVNYRHVATSLRHKPRAFLHCTWQQELLPNDDYRQLWQRLVNGFNRDMAARLMVEALYIAACQDAETAVALYLQTALDQDNLTLVGLQTRFGLTAEAEPPSLSGQQHSLSDYDQLLNCQRDARCPPPVAAPHPYAPAVAGTGSTGSTTGLDSCPVSSGSLRVGGDAALSASRSTGATSGSLATG